MRHKKQPAKSGKERMADYRRRMRAKGLRPVQIWVRDLRDPEVRAAVDRAIAAINADTQGEAEIMEWLDRVRDWPTD